MCAESGEAQEVKICVTPGKIYFDHGKAGGYPIQIQTSPSSKKMGSAGTGRHELPDV